MRSFIKSVFHSLPTPIRKVVVFMREYYWYVRMQSFEHDMYPALPTIFSKNKKQIQNVLVYHINGLSHSGTEKNLQLIANGLVDTYKVFYMYGSKGNEERRSVLDGRIVTIPFSYEGDESAVPHRIIGMNPHIKEIISKYDIDLMITASPGYAHYPWNIITEIPIILINIFGAPSLQKNICATVFISDTVRKHAEKWTGAHKTHHTMFLPLGMLPPKNARELGRGLRDRLDIPDTDFVFGRIGRDDDTIFDPIGIRAWQKIANHYPHAHYIIMSPAPTLVRIVEEEHIPRAHLLPPSGKEEDVWAFHGSLDAMAHFRKDGETSGVAIAESLMVGNPIVTHRSSIWNAHTEYLTRECARIAEVDNIEEYAQYLSEFIELYEKSPDVWAAMQNAAFRIGKTHFSPDIYVENIKNMVLSYGEII